MPFRCLIVDDNTAFLEAAATLLERQGVSVVGMATAIADALRQAQDLHPDVVLVDISLGSESGFDLVQCLADVDTGAATLILISIDDGADFADLIEEAPVAGFVAKSELSSGAILQLMAG